MAERQHWDVKRFVSEAFQAWLKERQKEPGLAVPVDIGPPWPNFGQEIGRRVSKELSSPEKSRKQLERRLKRIPYPYDPQDSVQPHGGKRRRKSFYRHVQSLGLLDFLLNPPFLWEVRRAWFFRRSYEIEKQLRKEQISQFGYPLGFHREMMHATVNQLGRMSRTATKHRVPRKWFADYYEQALKQLLRDASVFYPQLQFGYEPFSRVRPHALTTDIQKEIFGAITKKFASRRHRNNRLAYQLTALICSSPSSIARGILDPNPEVVRRNMRDRKKNP